MLARLGLLGLAASTLQAIPSISQQPESASTSAGRSVSFSVVATGSGPLSYQWRRDGFTLAGATSASLTLPAVSQSDFGSYDVLVNDGQQVVASALATLRVSPATFPGAITPDPVAVRLESNKNGSLTRVAVLPDGRFYLAGTLTSVHGQPRLGLARCLADGSLDPGFIPPTLDGAIQVIALQPDGRLLIAGRFTTVDGEPSGGLARLNASGGLDRTFQVGTGFRSNNTLTMSALAVGADGSVFVGGEITSYQGSPVSRLVKLSSTAVLDTGFAFGTPTFAPMVLDLAAAPDGKVYVVVFGTPALQRLLPNGTADPTFNIGTGPGGSLARVLRQADGKIVVGGSFSGFNGSGAIGWTRLLENGSADPSFTSRLSLSDVTALAQTASGDLLVGHFYLGLGTARVSRVRLDGTVDATFSSPTYTQIGDVAALPNGRVLAGGPRLISNQIWAPVAGLELLDATGRKTSFDAQLRFPGNVEMLRHQSGGKLIVAGDFTHWNGTPVASVIRINPDLTLDPTFRSGVGPNHAVLAATLQPDGKIVLVGYFTQVSGVAADGLARLNADGSVDTGFRGSATIGQSYTHAPRVLRDGRIIVRSDAYTSGFRVHEPNGTLITNHGLGAPGPGQLADVSQLPNGQVLFSGLFDTWSGAAKPRMVRLNSNGTIDPAFTLASPIGLFPLFDEDGRATQSTGKLTFVTGSGPTVVQRRLADGSADASFTTPVPFVLGPHYVILGDDRILFWAGTLSGTNYVARLRPDGSADPDFAILGELPHDASGTFRWERAAVTDAGDIVAVSVNGRLVRYVPVTRPVVTSPPTALLRPTAANATFTVAAGGPGPFSYQWYFNGTAIAGATGATLTLPRVFSLHAGDYHVTVTNANGTTATTPVRLTVDTTAYALARISNLSVRANLGDAPLITGFAVEGSAKQVLVRGIGPGLAQFGLTGVVSDPRLALYQATTLVDQNDNWSGTAALVSAASAVGAFPVAGTSLDAMLLRAVGGAHTAQLTGAAGGGVGLVEVYDTNPSPAVTPRLTNISARYHVGTGGDVLIAGFSIAGSGNKALLVRGVGPGLAQFGVPGTLADPRVAVFSGTTQMAENNDWGGSAELVALSAAVGAFPLVATSRDAALLLTVTAGSYTVQLSGNGASTGEGLIEIYEVP